MAVVYALTHHHVQTTVIANHHILVVEYHRVIHVHTLRVVQIVSVLLLEVVVEYTSTNVHTLVVVASH